MRKGYLKTREAAQYLSVDESFLKKNMGSIFKKGIHFFRPRNARIVRWKITAIDNWMQGEDQSSENKAVLEKLLA